MLVQFDDLFGTYFDAEAAPFTSFLSECHFCHTASNLSIEKLIKAFAKNAFKYYILLARPSKPTKFLQICIFFPKNTADCAIGSIYGVSVFRTGGAVLRFGLPVFLLPPGLRTPEDLEERATGGVPQ